VNLWSELRQLVFLRRIAKAQERTATACETIATVMQARWNAEHRPRRGSKLDVGSFDVVSANALYRDLQREAGLVSVEELMKDVET
jgi:hypothetical protein